ncbi:MAG: hypothetical protein ACREJB_08505 [Planctomycetaceae bacterium]
MQSSNSIGPQCARLTAACGLLWLALCGPAWWLAGSEGLWGLTISALLCLVPGLIVFVVAAFGRTAASPVGAVLLGMALRMTFVLVGVLVVRGVRPDLGLRSFLVWLVMFYLVTLAIETWLVLRSTDHSPRRPLPGSVPRDSESL